MLKPSGSQIIGAVPTGRKCPSCLQPMVQVTLRRADGKEVMCTTHDDGSFQQWTGGLGG